MEPSIQNSLFGLLCGLVGVLLGHKLKVGEESANRRRDFRVKMRKIRDKLKIHKDDMFKESGYELTLEDFNDACVIAEEDIKKRNRGRFNEARLSYCAPKDESGNLLLPHKKVFGVNETMERARKGREVLLGIIDRIISSAK